MRFRSYFNSDKSRQDAELRALGLGAAPVGHWQEVLIVAVLVTMLGLVAGSYLGVPVAIWKISGFVFFGVGIGIGLWVRLQIFRRLAAQKYARSVEEAAVEMQKKMKRKREKAEEGGHA